MNKFVKSVLAVGIYSAVSISASYAAKYSVEPITELPSYEYTYGQKQNGNSQEFIVSAGQAYNFPFQVDELSDAILIAIYQLSFTNTFFGLEPIADFEEFMAGNFTANAKGWIFLYLQSNATGVTSQKIGSPVFIDSGSGPEQIQIFDTPFSDTNTELTQSTNDFVSGISTNGWLYGSGSAPSLPVVNTDDNDVETTYWLSDFSLKAFISLDNGTTIIPVEAPENEFGGVSTILDMAEVNNTTTAVGYASVDVGQAAREFIESTETTGCSLDELSDVLQQRCIQLAREADGGIYHLNAMKWSFDNTGAVTEAESLGLLVTPHEDDNRLHLSRALAINSAGVAVGEATNWVDETETEPSANEFTRIYAAMFKDGEVFDLAGDHSDQLGSRAYDINEQGIAVGHIIKQDLVSGGGLTQYFYLDTNVEPLEMIYPDEFFINASSTARSINDNGLIVGDSEVEQNSQRSRRNGFLYDINTSTLTNLNDFLACNSDYTITEARYINNANEITATAVITKPRRDAEGQLVVDDNGETVFEDVLEAVKLTPIAGEIESCDVVEGNVIERKGASFGWLLILLIPLLVLRKKAIK